jgi:triacylglycerol lipase
MSAADQRKVQEVLPVVSLDKIAPPYPDYPYFQGHESRPFRHLTTMFDMQNAWWLIEAATLAYSEEDFVTPRFETAGLPEVRFFDGQHTDTQCYVANNDQFVIVAFRGTEIRKRPEAPDFRNIATDIKTDANIWLVDSGQGGQVHQGFKKGLNELWDGEGLRDYIANKDDGNRSIWFTGHSLGAALATLAAYRYGKVRGLYTFGSPRVGDTDFKNQFHISTYRFVNNNDIVARVPPPGRYCHVGELKYIDSRGRVRDNPSLWERTVDGVIGDALYLFNSLGQIRKGFAKVIPDAIVDHVPLLYATHIWNSIS